MRNTSNGPTLDSPLVLFVSPDVRTGGDSIHIGSTECYDSPYRECTMPIAVIPGTESGDYCGSVRDRSNYRSLLADESVAPYLIPLVGSHGYTALAYPAYLGPVPLCEPLAGNLPHLFDGYCIDEDDESRLENELESEAWADHGRRDFRRTLAKVLDTIDADHEHDVDDVTEDALDVLWHDGCDELNVDGGNGCSIETGYSVYFRVDEWSNKAVATPTRSGPKHLRATLLALATTLRIIARPDGVVGQ